jgi:hypothetical protein
MRHPHFQDRVVQLTLVVIDLINESSIRHEISNAMVHSKPLVVKCLEAIVIKRHGDEMLTRAYRLHLEITGNSPGDNPKVQSR